MQSFNYRNHFLTIAGCDADYAELIDGRFPRSLAEVDGHSYGRVQQHTTPSFIDWITSLFWGESQ